MEHGGNVGEKERVAVVQRKPVAAVAHRAVGRAAVGAEIVDAPMPAVRAHERRVRALDAAARQHDVAAFGAAENAFPMPYLCAMAVGKVQIRPELGLVAFLQHAADAAQ